ncbi:MAG: hypothetical protein Q8R90_00825 [Bacteroidales bacterium]|nr:hypothetical protein [Bacteroidales bacterium]
MKKYRIIKEENVSGDIALYLIVKRKINEWADSVPNHNLQQLGDHIDIKAIWYRPTYLIKLKSLYDTRYLRKQMVPFTGESLPKQRYFKESEVDVWDFDLGVSEGFEDGSRNFIIEGSQHIEPCARCGTKGRVDCPECRGVKYIICKSCGGKKKDACDRCDGTGNSKCSKCNGRGRIEVQKIKEGEFYTYTDNFSGAEIRKKRPDTTYAAYEDCSACNGRGKNTCSKCGGDGEIICKNCEGKGRLACKRCSATGSITCPECSGKRYMLHSLIIERKDHAITHGQFITHGKIFENFAEYKEKISSFTTQGVFSLIKNQAISLEDLPESSFIDRFVEKYIQKSAAAVEDNHRMAKQLLEIDCSDSWVVDYEFRGYSYSLVLAGREMVVIPGKNPISDYAEGFLNEADTLLEKGDVVGAWTLYKKAQEIDSFELRERVNRGEELSLALIKGSHKIGAIIGIIISAAAFMPYIYNYYFHVNKVFGFAEFMKDPDFFLYRHHPWAMMLFSLLFLYSAFIAGQESMNNNIKFISKKSARIATSIVVTVLMAALLQATLILLNATAFTLIITFIVWLFTFWV